jgi:hypothetical protein
MIATLLESGCDPNERISGHGHAIATPWEPWRHSRYMDCSSAQDVLRAAEITLSMILAGALIEPPNPTVTEDWRVEMVRRAGGWMNESALAVEPCDRSRLVKCCNEIIRVVGREMVQLVDHDRAWLLSCPK